MRKLHLLGFALALSTASCSGTDSDDSGSSNSTTDATDSGSSTTAGSGTTTSAGACPGVDPMATVAEGAPCTTNDECMSGLCVLFGDVPLPSDAVCGPLPANCETRITGTVFDFETGATVPSIELKVAKALEAATNPTGVTPILTITADGNGVLDGITTEPINAAIGIVGLVEGPGFFLTATGIASPSEGNLYAPGVGIHDLWAVPSATLSAWSTALESDGDVSIFLPLGEMGGVVGMIRDDVTGLGVAGAVVKPKKDTSTSVIRYLNDDGTTFTDTMSGTSGIFILVAPGLAEEFIVEQNGMQISGDGTAGSASGAIFTLVMDVTPV